MSEHFEVKETKPGTYKLELKDKQFPGKIYLEEDYSEEELLDLSIEKWETIVAFYEERKDDLDFVFYDRGRITCALCIAYIGGGCSNCPVFAATERPGCQTTPYAMFDAITACNSEKARYAQEEVDFLKSLKKN